MTTVKDGSIGVTNERRAIMWMVLTMFLLAGSDTLGKFLSQTYPVAEIVWARFLYLVPLLFLWSRRLPAVVRTSRLGLQIVRGFMVLGTNCFFYLGLSMLPLAEAMAIMFVTPILVTAFSMPLLGERVGLRRRISVGFGFLGAVIIIRPGSDVMQWAAFLPLIAAFFFAFHQIGARVLSRTDSSETILFYSTLIGAILTTAYMPFVWVAPNADGWWLMGLMALCTGLANFTTIRAFTAAPAAVVSPFLYTVLIWGVGFGYFVFGELPDLWTIAGAFVIVASGVYMFQRERRQQAGAPTR